MPFDGAPPQPPQPDYQAIAQQYANLRIQDLARLGDEIVALRVELETTKAALKVAGERISDLEKVVVSGAAE